MALDYEKRLRELRRLDFMEDYKDKPKPEDNGFMRKRVVEEQPTDDKNPLQKFQEVAFMQIMFLNKELKEKSRGEI
jgi:hypothetical protein|tara:strand:- start:5676 stop:5903 length:228 start_codon:yes stop_codon:yes gene_type:complete